MLLATSGCGGAQARKAKHLEKGHGYLDAGNLEKARVEFQNALQIAPKDPDARYEMGIVDEKLGKNREAAQFYRGVIDVAPDHVGARTKLARMLVLSAAPDLALETLKPGIDAHPDDPELLTVRAAARAQQKDVVGARADAERAVQLQPQNEDAVAVLAGLYKASHELPKAEELLERTIATVPAAVDLRMVLAQLYLEESRLADGEAQLLKIVELKPEDRASYIRLAQFYSQTNQPDAAEKTLRRAVAQLPKDRDMKLSLVQFLTERRSKEAAEKELQAFVAAAPEDRQLTFALGKLYEEVDDPAKAQAEYQSVIDKDKLESTGLEARDLLAALRLRRNDVAGALALANEVLAASPRDDDALVLRGNISLSQRDARAAIADLRSVLRDQPNAIGVLRTLARAHLANGEPALAEETLRHAIETSPKNAALQLDFANLLLQIGKPEQARPIVAAIIKHSPDNLDALDLQFRLDSSFKDYSAAKTAADAIVALKPRLAAGYFYQGLIAEAEKHPEDALRLYGVALDQQPAAVDPLEAKVRLLRSLKRTADALQFLDAMGANDPKNALVMNLKGNLLLADGRAPEAETAYNQAIARAPTWWIPYRGLAKAQIEGRKDPMVAVDTLRKAKPLVDEKAGLGQDLASLLERLGKPDEAILEYEDILRANPQAEIAANNLAMLLATYKTDPASLNRAKTLSARFADSTNLSFLDTYGWVLYKHGDAAASVPVLSKVVEKVPDQAIARYHLGMAQSLVGDNADARENLTRAINSGTKFSGLDDAKATLEKIAKLPATAAPAASKT